MSERIHFARSSGARGHRSTAGAGGAEERTGPRSRSSADIVPTFGSINMIGGECDR